jgi:hypothetical protein
MRIHKTQYATWTDEEILKLADQQGFSVSDLGIELMERLEDHIDITAAAVKEAARLQQELNDYIDSH